MSVPALRFVSFNEPWAKTTIGEIGSFYYGKSAPKWSVSEDAETPCIRYGELYTKFQGTVDQIYSRTNIDPSNLKFSKGGEILVPRVGEDPNDFAKCSMLPFEGVAIGEMISVFNTDEDSQFYTFYFRTMTRPFAKMVAGSNPANLYFENLKPLTIYRPSLPEQKKIAVFLGVVDAKIAALKARQEGLARYKRGLMQALFSQTLRFTKPDGTPFPDWEERRLGEVFTRVTRKNAEDNQNVLTISAQQGLVNQRDYFNKSVSAQDVSGYYLLHKGDFAYNKSYSKGYPMGAIKRLNNYEKGVVSTLYICFGTKSETVARYFEQFFEFGGLNREIHKIAQEGARNHGLLNMSVVEFFRDIQIILPHPDEQKKIAEALIAMDAKIAAVSEQAVQMEAFKKGLLQQMYV